MYDCIGFLLVLVVGYSLLAGYVIAVHPMENGAAMEFYNPLNIRCNRRKHLANDGEEGVVAANVSKSYGKVDALKPFSLTMKTSEVTAILGKMAQVGISTSSSYLSNHDVSSNSHPLTNTHFHQANPRS